MEVGSHLRHPEKYQIAEREDLVRQAMTLPKAARYLAAVLVFAFAAGVLLLLLPTADNRHQVFVQSTHEFGIGFDLSASYG